MKKAWKAKWVKALRSGKYKQARGQLRREYADGQYAYCCLGALCDIASGTKWRRGEAVVSKVSNVDVLSGMTLDKFGLSYPEQGTLTKMNDLDRASFKKIATYIEKNL